MDHSELALVVLQETPWKPQKHFALEMSIAMVWRHLTDGREGFRVLPGFALPNTPTSHEPEPNLPTLLMALYDAKYACSRAAEPGEASPPIFDLRMQTLRTDNRLLRSLSHQPPPIVSLFRCHCACYSGAELFELREETFTQVFISTEESKFLESCTRQQSNSCLWYDYRVGRITASKLHTVANTDP